MSELKDQLATLRIDRDRPASGSRRWPYAVGLVLAGTAAFLLLRSREANSAPEVATVVARVSTSGSAPAGSALLTASGYVVARRKAVVSAKIQGRLAELRVEEGSRVRQGALLARLESTDYQAQVQRAEANVQRAQADLDEFRRQEARQERLAGEKVTSQDELEAAHSRVKVADAGLAQAKADLAYAKASLANTQILAPFSGTVVKKMAEVGESVAPIPPGVNLSTSSGAIVALADLETLEVEADVSESNVAKLGPQQPAEVTVEAFPDARLAAVLRQIIPTADRTKATVQVKVTILDRDARLKPEMSARVTFKAAEAPAPQAGSAALRVVTVPAEAVVSRDGRQVVFEVRDGKALQRVVVTSGQQDGHLVVREGLSGTEVLVARPPDALRDGASVKVKP